MNIAIILATGLIPLVVGFVWYNNSFGFGKAWMASAGLNEEELNKNFNPLKVFGFTYLFGLFLAGGLMPIVIHQMGLGSMMNGVDLSNKDSQVGNAFAFLMDNYGSNYRTFKHGVLHGAMSGLFLALPILGVGALFERRSWKYIFIHVGYWIVTLGLMGGVVCSFFQL